MSMPVAPLAENGLGNSQPQSARAPSSGEYGEAVEYLFGLINYERVAPPHSMSRDFRLDRMRALLEAVGSPQEGLPAVHIAGTKGKGSTAAMLADMLQAGGVRTGLFTSPHIHRLEERMSVNGRQPSEQEIVALTRVVREAADKLSGTKGRGAPTFFEVTTTLAWLYFAELRAELIVLETGLGGRLDATNVCRPVLTMITSISRDHMHLLGDTLPEIASEKAGIIKPGVPVISGVTDPAAREVIVRVAAEHSAPLMQLGETIHLRNARPTAEVPPGRPGLWTGDVETPIRMHHGVAAPLAGAHQLANAALAVAAFDALQRTGVPIDDDAIQTGLNRVQLPLRIEVLRRQPLVIADAAHNEASIAALLETLREIPASRRHLIFGASRDKDVAAMLRLIAGGFDNVVLTRYTSNPRALELDALCRVAAENGIQEVTRRADPKSAWEFVQSRAGKDDLVCVTGSFFLAAEFRELLVGKPPVPEGAGPLRK